MKVIFSEEERIEVREGLKLRQADLQRLRKKLEEARLYSAVREVEDRLEVVARLFRDTMSEEEIAAETGRDPRQLEIPTASEGQSVEEALEGVEEEAAARLLEQEIDRALEYAPLMLGSDPKSDAELLDGLCEDLESLLDPSAEDVEPEVFGGRVVEPGEFVHRTEAGHEVLCRLSLVEPEDVDGEHEPCFEYDAVPKGEEPHGRTVTIRGAELVDRIRRVYAIPRPACAHERVVVEDGVLRCEDCGEQVPDEHAPIAAEAAAAEVADGHDAP